MNDTIKLEVAAPRATIADLWFDPKRIAEWMLDTRVEIINDDQYRMVSKSMTFTVTVVSKKPPEAMKLHLDGPGVTVDITAELIALTPEKTLLVSAEEFRFAGFLGRVTGVLARPMIRKAHREQMEALKQYAERQP